MTKTEFYRDMLSDMKELAAECVVMDAQRYEEFKCVVMEECDARARGFLRAVLSTIDRVREEKIKRKEGSGKTERGVRHDGFDK